MSAPVPCTPIDIRIVGTATDSSQNIAKNQNQAVYASKRNQAVLRFSSYAEKYAYMQGKLKMQNYCGDCPS